MTNERDDDSMEKGNHEGGGEPEAPAEEAAPAAPGEQAAADGTSARTSSEVSEDEVAEESRDDSGEAASGASAFKDSGSFFRDQVARTLAEQGFDLRKDGTWGSAVPEEPTAGATGERSGEGGEDTGSDVPESGPAASVASTDSDSRAAQADIGAAASAEPSRESGPPAPTDVSNDAASADDDDKTSASGAATVEPSSPSAANASAGSAAAPAAGGSTPRVSDTRTGGSGSDEGAADADPEGRAEFRAYPATEFERSGSDAGGTTAAPIGGRDEPQASETRDEDAESAKEGADESRSWFTPRVSSRSAADAEKPPSDASAREQSGYQPSAGSGQSANDASEAAAGSAGPAAGGESGHEAAGTRRSAPVGDTGDASASSGEPASGAHDAAGGTPASGPGASAQSPHADPASRRAAESDPQGSDRAPRAAAAGGAAAAAAAGSASSADSLESAEPAKSAGTSASPRTAADSGGAPRRGAARDDSGGRSEPGHGGASHPGDRSRTPRSPAAEAASGSAAASGAADGSFGTAGGPSGARSTSPSDPAAHSPAGPPGGTGPSGRPGPGGPSGPSGPSGPTRPPGRGGPPPPGGGGGKPKAKAKKPFWWRASRTTMIAFGILAVLVLSGFGVAYATIEVPDVAKEEATNQGSTFFYADGETQFAERGVDREPVDYDQIPTRVQEAVISAEDRGYWDSPGVSITGTVRAVWFTVTGQQVQGGSTITQQFVRNYFEGVSREQTVSRKLKEIIIALKVDQSPGMDKEWVMEQYLNTIYFGRNAYGIQSAAQAYYHKDVGELTGSEAAFLAAAIQQPSLYGQADESYTDDMRGRWQYVVDGMVEVDAITQSEADKMEFPKPKAQRPANSTDLSGFKGYMLQQAMEELKELGYTEDNINRGGYKVVTTFDQQTMRMAKQAVEDTVDVGSLPDGVRAGLTAVEPSTGEVKGFYGGHDYMQNQYDSSFDGSAQAGSAFKPYVLATALRQGYSLNSKVNGNTPIQVAGSSIHNYDDVSRGPTSLVEATRISLNTGYVQLAQEVGEENVRQTAYDAGIAKGMIEDDQVVPTIALGVSNVRPVDQATGFATFANGGKHVETHVIREVINQEGENERPKPKTSQPFSQDTAANVSYALQQVVQSGTGTSGALPDGRPVAGKTGTTDDSVAAWFVGYTPQLSTAVGVYNGNNQPFSVPGWGELSGGSLPAAIWNNFMTNAMEGKEVKQFPEPTFDGQVLDLAPDPPPSPEQTEPTEPSTPATRPEEPSTPEPPVETEPQEPTGGPQPDPGGTPTGDPTDEPGIPGFEPGGPGTGGEQQAEQPGT
ncbi:transglycosylase domain-containing protein [Streptomonospora litoralis]|uniref:Penicillin-binding protein 1A n=1 Tax=Streptomonospora litoralis TaxID=2498135 RepID=A0A4P6PYW4_9ACTN|nr:transglycosylase domain-containing protein [Streptomonospora litoralis]QBI52910.1 Penicillin-binding protein 1A [Streptomonospora litoralis]